MIASVPRQLLSTVDVRPPLPRAVRRAGGLRPRDGARRPGVRRAPAAADRHRLALAAERRRPLRRARVPLPARPGRRGHAPQRRRAAARPRDRGDRRVPADRLGALVHPRHAAALRPRLAARAARPPRQHLGAGVARGVRDLLVGPARDRPPVLRRDGVRDRARPHDGDVDRHPVPARREADRVAPARAAGAADRADAGRARRRRRDLPAARRRDDLEGVRRARRRLHAALAAVRGRALPRRVGGGRRDDRRAQPRRSGSPRSGDARRRRAWQRAGHERPDADERRGMGGLRRRAVRARRHLPRHVGDRRHHERRQLRLRRAAVRRPDAVGDLLPRARGAAAGRRLADRAVASLGPAARARARGAQRGQRHVHLRRLSPVVRDDPDRRPAA